MKVDILPSEQELITKAEVLLEALPYIQRFKGSIFVIKYGGSFMDDPNPEIRARVAQDIVFLASVGIFPVVVHGGGKAISRALEDAGIKHEFVNGFRVTSAEAVSVAEQTLNKEVNPEICEILQAFQGRPTGLFGNALLECVKMEEDEEGRPVDLGRVGKVRFVKTRLIKRAIQQGYIPVISPLASDEDGEIFNVNADVAAAHVACALRARRLVYMTDVPGLLADPNDPASLISTLKTSEVDAYRRDGVIGKGMNPKISSAVMALQEGVHRVHLVNGLLPHSILLEIFTHRGVGTEIVNH